MVCSAVNVPATRSQVWACAGTEPSAAFAPGSVKVALGNTTWDFEKNMKADFSAGEVREEACWGGAGEERYSSIFPSHRLFGLVCWFKLWNDFSSSSS